MDQGLKERLVGAAVLVAIAVWLIPWVLDGPEGGAETPASSLQLPSAEEPMPMRTQTLKLGDAPEPHADSAPAPATTPPPQLSGAAAEPLKAAAEPRRDPAPQAETTVAAATHAAEHPAQASTAAPPKPEPKAEGDWTVQLGVFEDEANAKRLAQRSATFGYKAEVSSYRSSGRTLYRVRVGPQATRGAADAAASALKAHGVEARVVAAR
ncbi:MAG TPA: SPOR domain-containing protein [Gammaproteobacteria bacterium]